MNSEKTVVFGIDGAHFELIKPWLQEGDLPNIEALIDSGVTGDLQSVLPPVTSPNWKCYMTGKNPGKIGIFWWENVDIGGQRVYYPSERKHENTEFWEIISYEEPVGVIGVPTTYPPKETNGFVVAGAPDGMNSDYTTPEFLESELEDKFGYKVLTDKKVSADLEGAAEEILERIEQRYLAAEHLMEEYDISFLQVTTFYINTLHHYLWRHEYTKRGWEIIDKYIEKLNDYETNVIVMSDHGATKINTVFNINTWLEREGLLSKNTAVPDLLYRLGLTRPTLARFASSMKVLDLVRDSVPARFLKSIPDDDGNINQDSKTIAINWEKTKALASGQGPIYFTSDIIQREKDRLRNGLSQLKDPEDNVVLRDIYKSEEIYSGKYMADAPDLVMEQNDGVHIPGSLGEESIFTDPESGGWKGENKRSGIFIADGPDFKDCEIEDISILDLAPTILHLHDCPIPSSMDGRVLEDIFNEDSPASHREPKYTNEEQSPVLEDPTGGSKGVRDRLDDLGYLN